MATVVLTALGTVFGGPLGAFAGSLIGQQIDGAIFGSPRIEGPRLKDFAVSTSSYGQPLPRHFGSVRAPGTIIWSSDLKETKETSGGGKGRPSTTTYAYSVSFAVILSSGPIDRVGRIWADGNLLRGAAGDLKSSGRLRIHTGHGDQQPDPLLAAVLGTECPAHRGCAYAVFEDLALADFGNRIPGLSFELFAGHGPWMLAPLMEPLGYFEPSAVMLPLEGFSHEGGSIAAILAQFDRLGPISPVADGSKIRIPSLPESGHGVHELPLPAVAVGGEFGREIGQSQTRVRARHGSLTALRYYDKARDYQPGLQRAQGLDASGGAVTLELPGVLEASVARSIVDSAAKREAIRRETLSWRLAQLDPSVGPGSIVRAPGVAGLWMITEWEWRETGIELQLTRHIELDADVAFPTDPGIGWIPPDRLPGATLLRVFEVPWDGYGSGDTERVLAALDSTASLWAGAALFAKHADALEPIGTAGRSRATTGNLVTQLNPSTCLRFEGGATLRLRLNGTEAALIPAGVDALARGANRLLVGAEVLQFANAEPTGDGEWLLTGLLRGRGGTEIAAQRIHAPGTAVTLLDDQLVSIASDALAPGVDTLIAAIGRADEEPVYAALENRGASRRPPSPCHPRMHRGADGTISLSWARRSRGGWAWLDEVDQPLVEQSELYEIGIGPAASSVRSFVSATPFLTLDAVTVSDLEASHAGAAIWVRQSGSFGKSFPLLLGTIGPAS